MLVVCLLVGLSQAGARRRPVAAPAAARRDVLTTQGVVRGYMNTSPPHFAYFGVPYAAPPTHHARYESPQPPRRWDGVFEATHRVRCPQRGLQGDENCLVLNIFVPEGASSWPVLVHFHDGAFNEGWGSYEPPRRLLERSIVVVTFNSRLGALGYLCLPGTRAGGNFGLKDQVAALYWLQRNIANFGGNPAEVTVYGKGTGAASIEFLILSRLTEGLFHKAILESGSALSPYSISYDSEDVARKVADNLKLINNDKFKDLYTLYQQAPVSKLVNTTAVFLPCIEEDSYDKQGLVYADSLEILQKGTFQKVPIIYAFTNQEGIKFMDRYEGWNLTAEDFFQLFLPVNLEFETESTKNKILNMIWSLYIDTQEEEKVNRQKVFSQYFADIAILYPMLKSALLTSSQSSKSVYLLEFSYTSMSNFGLETPNSDITSLIFSNKNFLSHEDELARERLITMWSNFIKFSDPTPLISSLVPLIWPPVQHNSRSSKPRSIHFGHTISIRVPSFYDRFTFWDTIYKRFHRFNLS